MKRPLSLPAAQRRLLALRKKIDRADQAIVKALVSRAKISLQVGAIKRQAGLPVRDPAREKALQTRLGQLASKPLSRPALLRIYRVILSESRRLQCS